MLKDFVVRLVYEKVVFVCVENLFQVLIHSYIYIYTRREGERRYIWFHNIA